MKIRWTARAMIWGSPPCSGRTSSILFFYNLSGGLNPCLRLDLIDPRAICGGIGGLGEDSSLDEGGWRESHNLAKGRAAHKTWVLDEAVPLWGPWERVNTDQDRSDGPITGLLYTFNSNPK